MRVAVLGGAGFIAHHLANKLKKEGNFVRTIDINPLEYESLADEHFICDLTKPEEAHRALEGGFDEVYQLAANVGGLGYLDKLFIGSLKDSYLINLNTLDACVSRGIKNIFFASSVCVYKDMPLGAKEITEDDVYPALPDFEYGWEKLFSERLYMAYSKTHPIKVRIARFNNCYGVEHVWDGGKEKAPAALCRKVAQAKDGGEIEVWGDGTAMRDFIYVEDLIDGVIKLMRSNIDEPTNIGTQEYISVNDFVDMIADIAGKKIIKRHDTTKPVGVTNRVFSLDRIKKTGWKPTYGLRKGMEVTYDWINKQINEN